MAKKQRTSIVGTVLTVEYPSIGKKFSVDYSKYHADIRASAEAHGFRQKYGDAASGGTAAEKYSEVQAIHASLTAGQWERTATVDLTPLILEAVARIKKLKFDPAKGTLSDGKKTATPTEEQVKSWGSDAKVRAEIAQMRAEKARKLAEESKDELVIDLK